MIGAWTVLNHSGRPQEPGDADEPEATDTWLKAVDLVWKFAAAIAVVVTTNWFAVVLKEEHEQRKNAALEASERSKLEAEKNAQAETAAVRLRENVIQLLTNEDPYVRLIAVANAADLVSNHRPSGLSAAETLFTVALHDPNDLVKTAAAKCLPTGVASVVEKNNFSKAILQLAEERVSQPPLSADQINPRDHRLLDALTAIRQFATDPDDQSLAEGLAAKLSQSELPAATKASDVYAEAEKAGPTVSSKAEQQKLDTFAPAVVLAATNTADQNKVKEASAILQNTSAEAVATTIQKLPESVVQKLPARVYLQIAGPDQRAPAKNIQDKLVKSGYISPGIENVAGKGHIPDTLEVRYFDSGAKSVAESILKILVANGAKDGRVSYVIPTVNDLRNSADIRSHFEVWSGKNSF